jgi:hypothetical protein
MSALAFIAGCVVATGVVLFTLLATLLTDEPAPTTEGAASAQGSWLAALFNPPARACVWIIRSFGWLVGMGSAQPLTAEMMMRRIQAAALPLAAATLMWPGVFVVGVALAITFRMPPVKRWFFAPFVGAILYWALSFYLVARALEVLWT